MITRHLRHTGRIVLVIVGVVVVLTEEVLWAWTGRLMARLGQWEPVARLEAAIARQRPYLAMILFVLPWIIILPFKLVALYCIAIGHVLRGTILLAVGEVLGIAFLARLYEICRPSLLQLTWFARVEQLVIGWTAWAHRLLDMVPAFRQARALVAVRMAAKPTAKPASEPRSPSFYRRVGLAFGRR